MHNEKTRAEKSSEWSDRVIGMCQCMYGVRYCTGTAKYMNRMCENTVCRVKAMTLV